MIIDMIYDVEIKNKKKIDQGAKSNLLFFFYQIDENGKQLFF